MNIKGTFEVTVKPEAPFDTVDGVSMGRVTCDKRFAGPLDATSQVHMMAVRTPIETSGSYVALERVTGSLEGKAGTFVLRHVGTMAGGSFSLTIDVVPESGTGELRSLSGKMVIAIDQGKHSFDFDYELPG